MFINTNYANSFFLNRLPEIQHYNRSKVYYKNAKELRDSTAYKMKFRIKNFFSKCDQIRSYQIYSHSCQKATMSKKKLKVQFNLLLILFSDHHSVATFAIPGYTWRSCKF